MTDEIFTVCMYLALVKVTLAASTCRNKNTKTTQTPASLNFVFRYFFIGVAVMKGCVRSPLKTDEHNFAVFPFFDPHRKR